MSDLPPVQFVLPGRCHQFYTRKKYSGHCILGLTMEKVIKKYGRLSALVVFFIMPLLIYFMGDFPRRALYKDALSGMTLLTFFGFVLQFYLSRAHHNSLKVFKMSSIIHWHKILGYIFTGILFFHPVFIIIYHGFEPGLTFSEAFTLVLQNISTKGLLLGLIAWILMMLLGLMAFFRTRLFRNYKTWRLWHGIVSLLFITLAALHVMDLGRHLNLYMIVLIAVVLIVAVFNLFKVYFANNN